MTDPANHDVPPPPGSSQPPPAGPPTYPQAGYPAAPPAPYGAPAVATIPGKTLGIVALIVAIFANVIGLILGIVALVQSKKAGYKNGPALAAIIVGAVLMVVGIIVAVVLIGAILTGASEFARLCAEYGTGIHQINGVEVTLTCP